MDAARQNTQQLFRDLNVPSDISESDPAAAAAYGPYFLARSRQQELERFSTVLMMKIKAEHIEASQKNIPEP